MSRLKDFTFKNELYFIEKKSPCDFNPPGIYAQENIYYEESIEPLRNGRFIIRLPNWLDISPNQIVSCTQPAIKVEGMGRFEWEPLTIKLCNLVGDTPTILMNCFTDIDYFSLYIDILQSDGSVYQTWYIDRAFILEISVDDGSYINPTILECEIKIRYSNATLIQH